MTSDVGDYVGEMICELNARGYSVFRSEDVATFRVVAPTTLGSIDCDGVVDLLSCSIANSIVGELAPSFELCSDRDGVRAFGGTVSVVIPGRMEVSYDG